MKNLLNQRWFIALVFMVLYKPTMFSQMPEFSTFDTISNAFKLFVLIILLAWFLLFYQKVSLLFVVLSLFEVWRVICTFYCGGKYSSLFLTIFNALAIVLITEMGLKTNADVFLDGATFILGIYVFLNFLTVLIFPEGLYEYNTFTQNYLFGYRNNMIMMIMPAMILSIVRSLRYYNRLTISSVFISLASILSIFIAFSATSLIGICIFLVFIIMLMIGFMPKIFNMVTYLIINVIYFFGVIILRVQDAFAFIIVDMLGRDLTFTGRTSIWDRALNCFYNSPIFGVGEISNDLSRDLIGATHAHNYYLDLMYKSGIIGFILFAVILIICGNALYKNRNNGKIPFIVSGALFAFMIMLQSEAYYNIYYFFSIITLATFIEYALPDKDENGNFCFKKTADLKRSLSKNANKKFAKKIKY